MQIELSAASRHQHLVVFDPSAIPADTPVDPDLKAQDPQLMPQSGMAALASRGEALIVHIPTEDCEARMRVLVDEEPPATVRQKGTRVLSGALLRVPNGALKADGLEFLARPGDTRKEAAVETASIPPGTYAVDVYELMSWKVRGGGREARARFSRKEIAVHRVVTAFTWVGVFFIPANLFGAPLVVAYFARRGWRSAVAAAAIVLAIDAAILAGFRLLDTAKRRFPILARVGDAEAAFDRDNPDVVIVLTRRSADGPPGVPSLATIAVS